jgi:glycosyltransferase involved in cell wall biosynthesis
MSPAASTAVATGRSLSIIIPAYRESANIVGTLTNVTTALDGLGLDAEILVIDDGSTDNTSGVVRENQHRFPAVTLLVNDRNRGFGWTYRRGVDTASRDHIVMVHGDNAWGAETLRDLFGRCGEADIIVGYTRDMWGSRTISRTVASKTFTLLINLITWRWLHYYNGLQLHRADVLKSIRIQSSGFGFQAEVLVKALRKTKTVIEVPMVLTERTAGESKAFRWKNFKDVAETLWRLVRLEWGGVEEESDVRA